ncbi:MAG TPA: DUF6263 family protein [Gemmatimonadales bacterium]|nr:DUF6263 family protein [Gemmatimonadales bacterium]
MHRLAVAVLAVTALVPGSLAAQQRHLLRLRPPQGQVTRYRVQMEMWMSGEAMAAVMDTSQPMVRMDVALTRTITAVVADTITSQEAFDSVAMDFPAMPQMAAMSGQVSEMMRGMVSEERTTTRGRVLSQRIVSMSPAMQQMGGMGGQMGGTGNNEMAILFPERPVGVGETWTDSATIPTDAGELRIVGTYRLERMVGTVAHLSFTGTMRSGTPQAPATLQTSGQFAVDVGSGVMHAMSMTAGGSVAAQGMEMPMRMRISMNKI